MAGKKATILGIASYLPRLTVSNEQLAKENPDWDIARIFEKTGVRCRHITASEECASDLGLFAAQRLFQKDLCNKEAIDFLIFCSQSPDYFLPSTACLLQERLGLPTTCGALDVNLGCSGYIYCLALAKGLIECGAANNVLLITADTYSKFISPSDRSARAVFGDGAAATLISGWVSDNEIIGPFVFGTDGRGKDHLIVPAGGLRMRSSLETQVASEREPGVWRSDDNLYMNGSEIFNFSIRTIPTMVNSLLKLANLNIDQVDYFVFHQASRVVLEHLRKKLRISDDKFHLDSGCFSNTVSSTIPIALETAKASGRIKSLNTLMLVGFGVGFSWAGTIIKVV